MKLENSRDYKQTGQPRTELQKQQNPRAQAKQLKNWQLFKQSKIPINNTAKIYKRKKGKYKDLNTDPK